MFENCVIPIATESEQVVLGYLMLNGLDAVAECNRINSDMFGIASNQEIYKAIADKANENESFDLHSIIDHFQQKGHLESLGGHKYFVGIDNHVTRKTEIQRHVDIMIERWKSRRGLEICYKYRPAFTEGFSSADTLAKMQQEIMDALAEEQSEDEPLVSAYSDAEMEKFEEQAFSHELSQGLSYGCEALDKWTWGMQPGEVTIVGARSGVGKSSLMKQAAAANCSKGIPVSMFSLEMAKERVLRGLWAIVSGVDYRKVVKPALATLSERSAIKQAHLKVRDWPLRIYDRSDLHLDQIVSKARLDARKHGAQLILVDYAQSVEADGKDERLRVANVSKRLTKMAKSEKTHLMLLSQLRKVPAEYYSNPPTINDLRETGQLENDGHVVVLLHRGWSAEEGRVSKDGMMIIPKCRDGETGQFQTKFNGSNLTFQ